MIKEIQNKTKEVVLEMGSEVDEINNGVLTIEKVGTTLKEIFKVCRKCRYPKLVK